MLKILLIVAVSLAALVLVAFVGVGMYYEHLPAVKRARFTTVNADDVATIPLFAGMQRAEPDALTRMFENMTEVDRSVRTGDGPFSDNLVNPAAVTFAFDSRGKRNPFSSGYKTKLVVTVSFLRSAADTMPADLYYIAHARITGDNTLSSFFDKEDPDWTTDGAIARPTNLESPKQAMVLTAPERRMQVMALWRDSAITESDARTLLTRIVAETRLHRDLTANYARALEAAIRSAASRRADVDAFLTASGATRVEGQQHVAPNTRVILDYPSFAPRTEPIGYAYAIALGALITPLSDTTDAAWHAVEAAAGDSALSRVVVTRTHEGLSTFTVFAAEQLVGSDMSGALFATYPEARTQPGHAFIVKRGFFGDQPNDHATEIAKLHRVQQAAASLTRPP